MKARLNKRTVDAATYEGNGSNQFFVWDREAAGFALRVYPSGRKTFVVTYRLGGAQHFLTLGVWGEMTVEEARQAAYQCRAKARRGEDPAVLIRGGREQPTVADLAERYIKEHAEIKQKSRTVHQARGLWRNHILPRFGSRPVAEITRADVAQFQAEMASTPSLANQVRTVLSMAFHLAELWGWRPEGSNPCRGVPRYQETSRERYLSQGELARLGAALGEAERAGKAPSQALAAIRLLLLTGCRYSEILTLRWDEVDFERRCLHLPDSKTGQKTVQLNKAALHVLSTMKRVEGNPHVVPGWKPGGHYTRLDKVWDGIRREAGLDDVRLHDLRHSFASFGVNAGLNLPVIGKLLGHAKVTTTERYAHLDDAPVRSANEEIGRRLAARLGGESEPPPPSSSSEEG